MAAHVVDEGNQTASIVPNIIANTIHAFFFILAGMEMASRHFGRNWLDSCHFRAKLRVFRGLCLWGDETEEWRMEGGGGVVECHLVVEHPSDSH